MEDVDADYIAVLEHGLNMTEEGPWKNGQPVTLRGLLGLMERLLAALPSAANMDTAESGSSSSSSSSDTSTSFFYPTWD